MGNAGSANPLDTFTHGFHVLKVHPGSPGEKAGLSSFFDYIVQINDTILDQNDSSLQNVLKANLGKQVSLIIYNSKSDSLRETTVVPLPSDAWQGQGCLGVSIRFSQLKGANEHVWHVLDVYPNSPASQAGLQPHTDFIVGTPFLSFSDSEDFFSLINSNMNNEVELFVYSSVMDTIRQVSIIPNKDWGGNGSLGCDVGYGYLHRIPCISESSGEKNGVPKQPTAPQSNQAEQQTKQLEKIVQSPSNPAGEMVDPSSWASSPNDGTNSGLVMEEVSADMFQELKIASQETTKPGPEQAAPAPTVPPTDVTPLINSSSAAIPLAAAPAAAAPEPKSSPSLEDRKRELKERMEKLKQMKERIGKKKDEGATVTAT